MRPQRGWIGESHLRMLSGNAPVSNEQNARFLVQVCDIGAPPLPGVKRDRPFMDDLSRVEPR